MAVHHYKKEKVGKQTLWVCERCGSILDQNGIEIKEVSE